jgi:hypothetical protein
MSKIVEYFVSKLSFETSRQLIDNVQAFSYDNENLNDEGTKDRNWLVDKSNSGYTISVLDKNSEGTWVRSNNFIYKNGYYTWKKALPKNITKRQTFVSYYHHNDEDKRKEFDLRFKDLIVNHSVKDGDLDSQNSDSYIHTLINSQYMLNVTVLIVLLGPNTKGRKHVDWEISGALNYKVGNRYAGLLGLKLPTHPDYGQTTYDENEYPERFIENVNSEYAILKDWTEDRHLLQQYVEEAFANRQFDDRIINKGINLLADNLCD